MKKLNLFLAGFGSIFSMFPTEQLPKVSTPNEISKKAWQNVGKAMRISMNEYDRQNRK